MTSQVVVLSSCFTDNIKFLSVSTSPRQVFKLISGYFSGSHQNQTIECSTIRNGLLLFAMGYVSLLREGVGQ